MWEQVLKKLDGASDESAKASAILEKRRVADFIDAALQVRPWRRDQRIEHREILELLAAGMAVRLLATSRSLDLGIEPPRNSASPVMVL